NLGGANGALTFNGGTLRTTAGFTSSRDVTLAADGGFDVASGTALALQGEIDGAGGLIKQGSGTLAYDGDGSAFTGTTTVAAGSLIVGSDDAHDDAVLGGPVDVLSGARLGGHGTVGTLTVASNGTLAQGNLIGTLRVAG